MHSALLLRSKHGDFCAVSSRLFYPLASNASGERNGSGVPPAKYNFCGAASEAKGEWGNVDSGKAVAKMSCHKCAVITSCRVLWINFRGGVYAYPCAKNAFSGQMTAR